MGRTMRSGGKSGVMVTVGFKDLIEKIQEAEGDVEAAVWEAARKGAKAMRDELVSECNASGVPASVTNEIAFKAERDGAGNRFACNIGWRMPDYNPRELSAGHKAVFLNYGTPRRTVRTEGIKTKIGGRWVTLSSDRGYMDGRGFIGRAKKKARPKIKKAQKEALQKIIEEMK